MGVGAALAVVFTLGDPGITIDEPLDVGPGQRYIAALFKHGTHFFDRAVVDRVFADNAEHPPLGRWLLGIASTLGGPFDPLLGGPDPFGVHAGRLAPALCFAALVALVALVAGRRFGRAGGIAAGLALMFMPRMFAHAHFGALDTFLCLFWTAALLAVGLALERKRPVLAMAGAGLVWGLALLTKIHAWLLPPIALVWVLVRLPWKRGLVAILAWGAAGFALFLVAWPWLWYDTAARLSAYLGTGVDRLSLRVFYFGQVYADRDVPWHYPWVYFAVTVPVGLHLLGVNGLIRAWRLRKADPFPLLLTAPIGMFLALFSTNVPVYDGERLFLVVFPFWALLIGLGFQVIWTWLAGRRWCRAALIGFVLAQGWGVVSTHPFGLSYFNILIGGLPGAERLGLELTYWGDAIDPVLLDNLARRTQPGEVVALVPTLHHLQGVAATTPALLDLGITLQDESEAPRADWVLVYRRTAYWRPEIAALTRAPAVASRRRQGVWLSGLWHRH
ncbi:MAG: glycosyltransferase family 39 protein [Isosphaeraceae bacterium]